MEKTGARADIAGTESQPPPVPPNLRGRGPLPPYVPIPEAFRDDPIISQQWLDHKNAVMQTLRERETEPARPIPTPEPQPVSVSPPTPRPPTPKPARQPRLVPMYWATPPTTTREVTRSTPPPTPREVARPDLLIGSFFAQPQDDESVSSMSSAEWQNLLNLERWLDAREAEQAGQAEQGEESPAVYAPDTPPSP